MYYQDQRIHRITHSILKIHLLRTLHLVLITSCVGQYIGKHIEKIIDYLFYYDNIFYQDKTIPKLFNYETESLRSCWVNRLASLQPLRCGITFKLN